MDACVRSNLYDEALSIAGLANTLERRSLDSASSTGNNATATTAADQGSTTTNTTSNTAWVVVRQVVEQIRQRQEDLRQQLWQRLSQASVTLPDCLEVVTALRRLNAIDLERSSNKSSSSSANNLEAIHNGMEVQLQIDFLEARDVWLETTRSSAAANAGGVAEDLLDTIERYRTRVFEIATQFNAIFRANATTTPSAASQGSGGGGGGGGGALLLSPVSLIRMWMSRRVESFLQVLSTQLQTTVTETSNLRDALEAALFFATSLGRLGADFSARLPPLFEPILVQIITASWKDGAKQLNETLVTCREAGVATPMFTGSTETIESSEPVKIDNEDELGQPMPPPRMLLNYPPLARFVNAILTGYNELRRCLLPGAVGSLKAALGDLLVEVRNDMVTHERAVHVPGLKGQAAQLRQVSALYKEIVSTIVEPYVWGSLYAAIGNARKATEYYTVLQANLQPPAEEPEAEEKEEEAEKATGDDEKPVEEGNAEDGQETEDQDGSDEAGQDGNAKAEDAASLEGTRKEEEEETEADA